MFLVVDDDTIFAKRLCTALTRRGHHCVETSSVSEATRLVHCHQFKFAVLDLRITDGSGLTIIPQLVRSSPDCKIVVLTGYGSIATALEAIRLGATNYLTKPASLSQILGSLGLESSSQNNPPSTIEEVPTLLEVEWEHIHRVLTDCGGNITKAAKALQMHRRSLQRKLASPPLIKRSRGGQTDT